VTTRRSRHNSEHHRIRQSSSSWPRGITITDTGTGPRGANAAPRASRSSSSSSRSSPSRRRGTTNDDARG
jgi:hypothetical protein